MLPVMTGRLSLRGQSGGVSFVVQVEWYVAS
jgi:hypothetical protein